MALQQKQVELLPSNKLQQPIFFNQVAKTLSNPHQLYNLIPNN